MRRVTTRALSRSPLLHPLDRSSSPGAARRAYPPCSRPRTAGMPTRGTVGHAFLLGREVLGDGVVRGVRAAGRLGGGGRLQGWLTPEVYIFHG